MSNIAEKLTTIAENVPKVYASGYDTGYDEGHEAGYSAGQSSMVDESKLIPKTVSGSYISVDDVSEIPHSVGCKVESVNLCPEEVKSGRYYDAAPNASGADAGYIRILPFAVQPLTTYTFSSNLRAYSIWCCGADGGIKRIGWENSFVRTITTPDNCTELRISLYNSSGVADTTAFEYAMLNRGTEALPYTPYVSPESVSVTRTGKNLATAQQVWAGCDQYSEIVEDGRNAIRFQSSINAMNELPVFEENTQYTFSFDIKAVLRNASYEGKTDLILYVRYTDGTGSGIYFNPNNNEESAWTKFTLTTTAGKTVQSVGTISYGYFHWIYIDIDTFQLEKGSTALPYEPYNGQTLTPSADGTVEGMTSVSPYMNIFSDTEGVNIEAEYNKSYGMQTEYDRFWDSYLNKSQSVLCFAGGGWTIDNFKPPKDIEISNGYGVFMYNTMKVDLTALLEKLGVSLITENVSNFQNMFLHSSIVRVPPIDIRNSLSQGQTNSMFYGCAYLETIDKLIVKDTIKYSENMFQNCSSLANITFEGVIGNSINFQWCPLTKASITNIINTLSTTATGQTLTLKLSAVNTAFETSSGAADGSTSTEFAALVATKTNWTITMI